MVDTYLQSRQQDLETTDAMPAMSVQQAVNRYNEIVAFVKTLMKEGVHYMKIPGTQKNTLVKPGAEMLSTFFGFTPEFTLVEKLEDWGGGFFYYRYGCTIRNRAGQVLVFNAEGSINSKEKKYRYRSVYDNEASAEDKAMGRCEERESKRGGKFKVWIVENKEPWDLVNTLQKMAQKRALIAAVLIACNASEFFTQDMEEIKDYDPDGDNHPEQTAKPKQEAPKHQAKQAAKQPAKTVDADTDKRKRFIARINELWREETALTGETADNEMALDLQMMKEEELEALGKRIRARIDTHKAQLTKLDVPVVDAEIVEPEPEEPQE